CSEGNGTDYKENYELRVWLLHLSKTTADPKATCLEMSASAGKCIYVASDKSSLASLTTEEVYSSAILGATIGTSPTTYSDYCDSYIVSSSFNNYSDEAKVCNMNCQKTHWDSQSTTTCSATTTSNQFKALSSGIITCIKNCFQVTNNQN
ncbi:MAG: hypothetical protein KDK36_02895, partial [Leptospiraceae bacterium]|nr:hypothetical protein [Leptospiraceae bacterium]